MDQEISEERIDSLKSELESYGREIIKLTAAIYDSHPTGDKYDLKNAPQQMLPLLQEEVADLLRQSQENTAFFNQHQSKITYCNSLMLLLNNIAAVVDKVIHCEEALQSLSLQRCVMLLGEVKTLLATSSSDDLLQSSHILHILQREYRLLRGRLLNKVKRLLNDCIRFEPGKLVIAHVLQGYIRSEDKVYDRPLLLADLFGVIQSMQVEEEIMDGLARDVWRYLVRVLWKEKKVYPPHTTLARMSLPSSTASATASASIGSDLIGPPQDSRSEFLVGSLSRAGEGLDSGSTAAAAASAAAAAAAAAVPSASSSSTPSLSANPSLPHDVHDRDWTTLGGCRLPPASLVDHLSQLLSFLTTPQGLPLPSSLITCLGKKLMQPPYALSVQLQDWLSSQLPKAWGELTTYQSHLRVSLGGFQSHWTRCFGRQEDCADLVQWVDQLLFTSAQIKRREILVHARQLLLYDYHNIVLVSSGDALEDELTLQSLPNSREGDYLDTSLCIQKLHFDTCQISLPTGRLMKYLHEVMQLLCSQLQQFHTSSRSPSTGTSSTGSGVASRSGGSAGEVQDVYGISNILFHTARDVIELFMAIVPVKYHDVITSSPRMGAVFYNDCVYILHNLILITHKYKTQLQALASSQSRQKDEDGNSPASISSPALDVVQVLGFVDFMPKLRKLAEECLTCHLAQLKGKFSADIARLVIRPDYQPPTTALAGQALAFSLAAASSGASKSSSGGGANSSFVRGEARGGRARDEAVCNNESEVYTLLTHLTQLCADWEDILSSRVYHKLLAMVLEDVVQQVLAPVLAADCITVAAANDLQRLYRVLVNKVNALLAPSLAGAGVSAASLSSTGSASLAGDKTLASFPCPSWRKLATLTELLDYSLYDIAEAISCQRCSCFTAREMTRLIGALFEDTPKRQALLDSIKQAQW